MRFWMQNLDRVLGCTITLPALPDSLGAMALFGAAIPDPSSRTGGPRRTPCVRRETVSNFETGFHGLPLDETGFQGWF